MSTGDSGVDRDIYLHRKFGQTILQYGNPISITAKVSVPINSGVYKVAPPPGGGGRMKLLGKKIK